MIGIIKNNIYIILGWIFVLIGLISLLLPILPTTPFLIVALALFSKSSPRFHKMLLNSSWFGPALRQWEESKTVSRRNKYKATVLIVLTFSISIAVLNGKIHLQLFLACLATVLLFFIWRLKE